MHSNSEIKQRGRVRRRAALAGFATSVALIALPAGNALAGGGGVGTGGGGGTVPGDKAKLKANGQAVAPANAPEAVKRAIAAGNAIDSKRYCTPPAYTSKWGARCYDCSGAVSYVLGAKGARYLSSPTWSSPLARMGKRGKGKWITWYADSGHVFAVIAGLRWDTSMPADGDSGPGWSKDVSAGFRNVDRSAARHAPGL